MNCESSCLSSVASVLAIALLVSLCALSAEHGLTRLEISLGKIREQLATQTDALRSLTEAYSRVVAQNEGAQNSLRDICNQMETHRHDMSGFRKQLTSLEESVEKVLSRRQHDAPKTVAPAPYEFKEMTIPITHPSSRSTRARSVAFSPDSRLVTADMFRMLNVDTWESYSIALSLGPQRTKSDRMESVAFSPDGSIVAVMVSDYSASVLLLDIAAKKQVALLKVESERDYAASVAFSPDGRQIATGSTQGLRLWDVVTGELASVLPQKNISSVAFSPDGRTLVSGSRNSSDFTVRLWDVATATQTAFLEGHRARVTSVAFSPDGRTIASGSIDRTVRLWDAVTGLQVALLRGHAYGVSCVAFSPDARTLVSGSSELRLWDTATGAEIGVLKGHRGVSDVAFSPDGLMIASVGNEQLRLWV